MPTPSGAAPIPGSPPQRAAVAGALAYPPEAARRVRHGPKRSMQIVTRCIDYVDGTGIFGLSIIELVAVAGVSERRLRAAFVEVVGDPPIRYFRLRGLHNARKQLRNQSPDTSTVTDIAYSLGFTHLSRFASQYQERFNEPPSHTLQSHR